MLRQLAIQDRRSKGGLYLDGGWGCGVSRGHVDIKMIIATHTQRHTLITKREVRKRKSLTP